MPVGIISHQQCALHDMGNSHPESPARLEAIHNQLHLSGLNNVVKHYEAQSIDPELLLLVHSRSYVESIFTHAPKQGIYQLDPDTSMTPDTLNAALRAAGAGVQAVDLVMQQELTSAFCATRPPGHHAEKDRAMGFCIFNSIAIAAQYAISHYKLSRVAILDFDVHHGNGTQNIFANNDQVLFCSTFQHPFYPYSGTEETSENIINSPLSTYAKSEEFRKAVQTQWLPALEQFKPQMLFISAGFDAHIEDLMSQTQFVDEDYRWVTKQLKVVAENHAEGRIVSLLEGGYSLKALGRSVVAHVSGLIG